MLACYIRLFQMLTTNLHPTGQVIELIQFEERIFEPCNWAVSI